MSNLVSSTRRDFPFLLLTLIFSFSLRIFQLYQVINRHTPFGLHPLDLTLLVSAFVLGSFVLVSLFVLRRRFVSSLFVSLIFPLTPTQRSLAFTPLPCLLLYFLSFLPSLPSSPAPTSFPLPLLPPLLYFYVP